jgi:hypothetical protein
MAAATAGTSGAGWRRRRRHRAPDAPACCGAARPPPAPRCVGRVGERRAPTAPAPASPGHHGGSGLAAPRARQARVGRTPTRQRGSASPPGWWGAPAPGGSAVPHTPREPAPVETAGTGRVPRVSPQRRRGSPRGERRQACLRQRRGAGRGLTQPPSIRRGQACATGEPRRGQPWRAPAAGASAAVASAPASPRSVLIPEDPGRVRYILAGV